MTREEFLENNEERLKIMNDDRRRQAKRDLKKLGVNEWIEEYKQDFMDAGVNTDDMRQLLKSTKKLPERLREDFGEMGFKPSDAWKNRVYKQEYSKDYSREKFEEALSKMRDYYEQETKQRKVESDKIKRQREVKDWGWRGLLTSDYEKQRYVEDPQSALFGEQAPNLGKAPETRWGSAADLGLGMAGVAGDVVPGWGSVLLGPGARIARDVGHKVTDSPYQKEWGDIVKGGIADVMVSGGTVALPNFRKQMRMYNKFTTLPESVVAIQTIEAEAKNIKDGARMALPTMGNSLEFRKAVEAMPASQMKSELKPLLDRPEIDWREASDIIHKSLGYADNAATPFGREGLRQGYSKVVDDMSTQGIARRALTKTANVGKDVPKIDPLTKKILSTAEPSAKEAASATRKMLIDKGIEKLSNPAANLVVTVPGGRGKGKATRVETPEEREQIEAIKQREDRFWRAGFKPNKNESILYKAYKEWAEENGEE